MNNDTAIVYLPWRVVEEAAESILGLGIMDTWKGEIISACRKTVDTQGWCICGDRGDGFSVCGAVCPVHYENAVQHMRASVARLTEENDVLKRVIREDPKDYEKQSTHLVLLQEKIEKLRRRLKHKEQACHELNVERNELKAAAQNVLATYDPTMPPMLDGETCEAYTDRILDPNRLYPYPEHRNRQCSIGCHSECSDPDGNVCKCPCHTLDDAMDKLSEALWACSDLPKGDA